MRIVPNNRSESSSNLSIFLSQVRLLCSISFRSFGDKEKKAISEAETNPDAPSKSAAITMAIMASIEGAETVTPSNQEAIWDNDDESKDKCIS